MDKQGMQDVIVNEQLEQFICDEGGEIYLKALKLNDEESKNDPENEPYRSKYAARELWQKIKVDIKDYVGEADLDIKVQSGSSNQAIGGAEGATGLQPESPGSVMSMKCPKWKIMISILDLKMGVNYYETDELNTGELHLKKSIELIEEFRMNPAACNILQLAYNHLGILFTGMEGRCNEALYFLQNAESLYKDFIANVGNAPYLVNEVFGLEKKCDEGDLVHKRSINFDDTYTHTLYYLAQVYGRLEESKKSSEYCHVTLKRQLETKKYEPFDWSMNAATISQYYITVENFALARHCLASATLILSEKGEPTTLEAGVQESDSQADADIKEKLPRAWADLYRCWIKYGLSMISCSWQRLLADEEETNDDHNADKKEKCTESDRNCQVNDDSKIYENLKFDLELTSIENKIPNRYILIFDEAKEIFLQVQKWIASAKSFYTIDDHCVDFVEIEQDYSTLYKLLAYFEGNLERQCKMHKRRVDLLQDVLDNLNPQFYLLICRQLMFELAETFSAMVDAKLAIVEMNGSPPTPHAVKKINLLTTQSITKYTDYLNSLKNTEKVLPDKFADEDERPALIAHFCTGRLYSKFLEFETEKRVDNLEKTLKYYKYLVDYCEKNPSAIKKIGTERDVCAEMVELLPAKIAKIRTEALA